MASRELLQRIATALVLAPLVLAALLALPTHWFALFLLSFISLAAWEWASINRFTGTVRMVFFAAIACASAMLWWLEFTRLPLLVAVALWWLVVFVLIVTYPRGSGPLRQPALSVVVGVITLTGAWIALVDIHDARRMLVLWLLLQVWASDIGAYFAGQAFGRRKLAPKVSPGKTWEGLFGGVTLALVVAAGWALLDPALVVRWHGFMMVLAISLLIVSVSVVGDLAESLQKRMAEVKDSGQLLPGHGGVLDRIDSILAAAPAFALVLWSLDALLSLD